MRNVDEGFFVRADAHIDLSNTQISADVERGKVSASFMYSVARFNAWISACGFNNSIDMANAKEKMMDYFISDYRIMLEENLDDYIANFDSYMKPSAAKR